MIGAHAATGWLPAEIARDSHGFILTGPDAMKHGAVELATASHTHSKQVPRAYLPSAMFAPGRSSAWLRRSVRAAWRSRFVHKYLQVSA